MFITLVDLVRIIHSCDVLWPPPAGGLRTSQSENSIKLIVLLAVICGVMICVVDASRELIQGGKVRPANHPIRQLTCTDRAVLALYVAGGGFYEFSADDDLTLNSTRHGILYHDANDHATAVLCYDGRLEVFREEVVLFSRKIHCQAEGMKLSGQGRFVAVTSSSGVTFWDLRNERRKTIEGKDLTAIAFSPDERRLLAAKADLGVAEEFDVETGALLRRFPICSRHAAYSPDGAVLVTNTKRGELTAWNLNLGEVVWEASFPGTQREATSVLFDPTGRYLVYCDVSGTVRLIDARTGGHRELETAQPGIHQPSFFDAGKRLVIGGPTAIRVWDPSTWQLVTKVTNPDFLSEAQTD